MMQLPWRRNGGRTGEVGCVSESWWVTARSCALLRHATHMISRLRPHQGHLVVAAAEQSPDSVQFTLDRREKWRVQLTAGHICTPKIYTLGAVRECWRQFRVLMRNKGHNQEIYQSFTSFLMSPVMICCNI